MIFDVKKKFVVVGRGRENKERLIFNLDLVNILYLNYEPVEWVVNYYRGKYPDAWKSSLFSFQHGAHQKELKGVYNKKLIPVISWKEKPEGIKINNVSAACLDWLGRLNGENEIYLTAFDMGDELQWFYKIDETGKKIWWQQSRDWQQEVRHIKSVFAAHPKVNYQFLTYNKYFHNKDRESQCTQLREKLINEKAIIIEFNQADINKIYEETGSKRQQEPGEVIREKYQKVEKNLK